MKRFQMKRITKTKNCVFLAGLIAGSILLGCAAQEQVTRVTAPVQPSISGTGVIEVSIDGLQGKELLACDVKAISSGKEYLVAQKIAAVHFEKDDSTGKVQVDQTRLPTGIYLIKGVPAGPAEVRVRLKKKNLPAQTVEVKEGTVVRVWFEFK